MSCEEHKKSRSNSVDEQIDEYVEYMYYGPFNIFKSIWKGVINLICPCGYKEPEPIVIYS
jgi:hypothetical protein